MKYIIIFLLMANLCHGQMQHFTIKNVFCNSSGFHTDSEFKTTITIDEGHHFGRVITELSTPATYIGEDPCKDKKAKKYGDLFLEQEDFAAQKKKAEEIIKMLVPVSPVKTWKNLSVGDSVLLKEWGDKGFSFDIHYPVLVTGFIFKGDDVYVRYETYQNYAGELAERVRLVYDKSQNKFYWPTKCIIVGCKHTDHEKKGIPYGK